MKKRFFPITKDKRLAILAAIIVVGLTASTLFFALQAHDLKNRGSNSQAKKVKQVDDLRKKIEKLIIIPKEEKTLIGTYDSSTELSKYPLFKNAKDGDKYLIFSESGKAIIYRESDNILVNVGPISAASEDDAVQDQEKPKNSE
ncbi:MAG: hypothetical protein CSA81_13910 [Acidobacteria bacterium]|nr:MAG: hypothetical protein CSA81_13910 [Acidobacteriota bacterium]